MEDPYALTPREVVCEHCHLTHNRALPGCPTCTEDNR